MNLEYLAKVVQVRDGVAFPDSLVGTDSHTTMINGLGVLGWGVGGIEAEACMLGQPIYMVTPQVVGFKLHGKLPEGSTATDLVLVVTQILRAITSWKNSSNSSARDWRRMSVADRATIANMAPEYGATMGFFPVDDQIADVSAPHRARCRTDRSGRAILQGAGPVAAGQDATPVFSEVAGTGFGRR